MFHPPRGLCLFLGNVFSELNSSLCSFGVVIILHRHVLNRWLGENKDCQNPLTLHAVLNSSQGNARLSLHDRLPC